MKLIYLTSQKYPSAKADPFFVKSMALAFAKILDKNLLFVVRGDTPNELKHLNVMSVKLPRRFRTILYFFWVPIFIIFRNWSDSETVFFSSDPYLLSILVFWRKTLGFKYLICSDWHQLFGDWKDKYVAGSSDYLISTSKRLKGLLSSVCAVNPDKIVVAYGGVDASLFLEKSKTVKTEYQKNLRLPTDSFLVGYVGGFRSLGIGKGLDTMIKALQYLDNKITMVFVGGSKKDIEEYITLAKEINVENRCIFVEKQKPFEKVIEYEMAMDILVIPYPDEPHFRDYGFPMKIWEYMASGKPIIYSDLEIMGEVLEGKAVSFEPDNASSLAAVIARIMKDTDAAEIIAARNPKEVENYTWEARAARIIDFVENGSKNTNNKRQKITNLLYRHISIFEDQMRYMKSEKSKIKRVVHNTKVLGLPYVFYSLSRFRLLGFLKNIRIKFFFGKMMILPASDMGASVFSMYGIMPHKSERRLALWLIKNLRDEEVFYDVGAHLGYYTALSEKILTRGEVHAFEANKKLCGYLRQNFSDSNNVFISCMAVADSDGEVDFYDATEIDDSSASSRFRIKKQYTRVSKVSAITLDDYVNKGNKPPTIIKFDIEGGEGDAIIGSLGLIRKYKPRIMMEVWGGEAGKKYSRVAIDKLKELGYKAFLLDSEGGISGKPLDNPIAAISAGGNDSRDNLLFRLARSM
ncbi:MAG: FkbM family methyltransferase [Patescibacteria group bacterium]